MKQSCWRLVASFFLSFFFFVIDEEGYNDV